jgi:hypothetical protein
MPSLPRSIARSAGSKPLALLSAHKKDGHAAVAMSSRSSTEVNADPIIAGPVITCSGANLSKSKTGVAIHWSG